MPLHINTTEEIIKLPVRARTNASRSSFANLPEIGLRGDSIPMLCLSQ